MKICPKCKAEIQEEARFCLYCMTSFEEKQTIETPKETNKWWLYIIAAVFAILLGCLIVFFFAQKNSHNVTDGTFDNSSFSSDLDIIISNGSILSEQQNTQSGDNKVSTVTSNHQTPTPSKNETDTINKTPNNAVSNSSTPDGSTSTDNTPSSNTTQNNTVTNNTTTNSTSNSNKTENDSSNTITSTPSTTTPSPETTAVTYIYRDAKYGDDYSVGASLENAVVITGVKTVAADGKYVIPETLDGKKVIAIMALAFCDDSISNTVKTVVVPSTVKTIWNNAFANCYNLTDIYFCGDSIYTESNVFADISKRNGILTIHCSANCNDRNYRYYKNSASNYDAEYEEWNG